MIKLINLYDDEKVNALSANHFLYELLKERDSTVNISHREMPTFENHCAFVASRPYREWFVIHANEIRVGSIYLSKQNEIGIFIAKEHQRKGYGQLAICHLMNLHPGERFVANINPHNARSINLFEGLGFHLLQVTYAKEPKCSKPE